MADTKLAPLKLPEQPVAQITGKLMPSGNWVVEFSETTVATLTPRLKGRFERSVRLGYLKWLRDRSIATKRVEKERLTNVTT